jgi:NADP-reducing hydrogenase subunit HndB
MGKKITSPQDLNRLRDQAKADVDLRTGDKDIRITVHMGTCGIAAGARDILAELTASLIQSGVETVTIRQSGCLGLCDQEPMSTLTERSGREYCYGGLDKNKVREIVREHVLGGNPVTSYIVVR